MPNIQLLKSQNMHATIVTYSLVRSCSWSNFTLSTLTQSTSINKETVVSMVYIIQSILTTINSQFHNYGKLTLGSNHSHIASDWPNLGQPYDHNRVSLLIIIALFTRTCTSCLNCIVKLNWLHISGKLLL